MDLHGSGPRDAQLRECGAAGCSVVLTFARCGPFVADQDAANTAYNCGGAYSRATREHADHP